MKTVRIILEQRFYVHKNRLAVMYRLAVHAVKIRKLRHSLAPWSSSENYARSVLISRYIRDILQGLDIVPPSRYAKNKWIKCAI